MSTAARCRILVGSAILAVAACAPRQTPVGEPSPCTDAVYLELRAEPPDSLSDREWTRLRELERDCVAARTAERDDRGGMLGMGRPSRWVAMGLGMLAMGAMGLLMWH